jgi:hypothetical protein
MLRSTRRGIFRHSYDISEDGGPVIALAAVRREGCVFALSGQEYRISRAGHRSFTLVGPAGEEATAERTKGRMWTVKSSVTGPLELVRTSVWRETWELRRFGETIGTLSKDGAFRRTSSAELPAEVPLAVRLFVVYVVEVLWERSRQAAAGGA